MDQRKIEILLPKFYNGETSLEEEKFLLEYFSDPDNIPEKYRAEREQFMLYRETINAGDPSDEFLAGLEDLIDRQSGKEIRLKRRYMLYRVAGLAASIMLFIGIYFTVVKIRTPKPSPAIADTYKNPQLAYEETQKVLLYVSEKLNQGTGQLKNFSKLNEPAEQLKSFKKLDDGLSKLNVLYLLEGSK
jgi:hypothetical protein